MITPPGLDFAPPPIAQVIGRGQVVLFPGRPTPYFSAWRL